METLKPASKKKFVMYGMPRYGSSILLTTIDIGLFRLYTEGYSADPFLTGFGMGMGKIAIAASQFLMGWLSDRINTRFGKRKPFMIIGAPLTSISFLFLLLPSLFLSTLGIWELFYWILIWDMIVQFFYGFLTTPYQSMMAEHFIVGERPTASTYQNTLGMLGTATGIAVTFLLISDFITTFLNTGQLLVSFTSFMLIGAILTIILYYICAYHFPVEPPVGAEMHFWEDVKVIIKDKNFMNVCYLQGIAFLALGMITPTVIGFAQDVLGFVDTMYYIAAISLFIGIILFILFWKKLIDKSGKKNTILLIFLTGSVVLPFSLIGLIPGEINFAVGIAYVMGVAATVGGWYLFPYIWYADLAEDADKRYEDGMRSGLYAGFPNVTLNIGQAISLIVLGALESLPIVSADKNFSWGSVLWGVWCGVIFFIGFLFIKRFITLDFDWEKEKKRE
jgi:GPH family glycoside/pentoside/hexuronide:cation symporter